MAEPRVRRLVERDIERTIELTDLEGWGYTHTDIERLLALSPRGCFAAEDRGEVVGVLSTTSYGPLAFLGAVIVTPEYRGQGVGRLLMQAALLHLASTGVETVRLNAYTNVISFYERLGFHREYEVVRWKGTPVGRASDGVVPVTSADLEGLAAFDAHYFGVPRLRLLERLLQENPQTFLVAREGTQMLGFLVGSPYDGACEIGPWTVDPHRPEVAAHLLQALAAAVGPREFAFSGPERNPGLTPFVQENGFSKVFSTLRMWWGKDLYPGDPTGVWAAAGLEKG